ncbi:hypothetical protein HYS00_01670 [Candidatus Microgenomates bacterium]|nr:hypothetical protein [Candidatus Microgenomates bacterium]
MYSTAPRTKATIEALWRLEKIILETLDFKDVATKIVNGLLKELGYLDLGYRIIVLTLIDKERNVLRRIALSQTNEAESAQNVSAIPFHQIEIPLDSKDNLLIKCIRDKRPYSTRNWVDLFAPILTSDQANSNQVAAGIKTSMVYPVIVHDEVIGVVIFSLNKLEGEVTDDERDLIRGFTDIIGLAVQNARLYGALSEQADKLKVINTDIYKKNAQLAEVNRLLTLLRSIDEIVLSSVTDIKQNAQQVTRLVVTATGVVAIGVLLFDDEKENLKSLAFSVLGEIAFTQLPIGQLLDTISVPITDSNNLMIQSVMDRSNKITTQLHDLIPAEIFESLLHHPEAISIKTCDVHPLIVRNEVIGVMVVMHNELPDDISSFKKDLMVRLSGVIGIALDNGLLYHGVQKANQRLKELDRLKDDFVSVASHELRTPMTAIRSYLWMAIKGRGGELTEKQKYYLGRAYTSTVRLINLVNDMLNISRIESGRISVNIQKVELVDLVESVLTEFKARADELGLTITLKKRTLPPVLADTGTGISEQDQQHLFQKFGFIGTSYKVNKSDSQGTGLGLYISKSIVDIHKGTLTVYSEGMGKGSAFSFSLKIYNDQDFAQFQKEFGEQKNGLGVIHVDV